ncbi:exodeoxyribonuclease V subunit beta [Pandoraea nosoerga]|uniref:RecBCD enzyme subunit RecB n=1 Tax=Pandoraea nosoerga TaxID=2508296 RepID=A0A5E4W7E1_9BURK|nr:exodeoxyribonuclease V subunit beta [Pandoraea nosoerga]MBN4665851.1 exodeoxyribonuclease V subunit beta [Pandoraea nosoerga]MBN4676025.1 exodeoxyribonuclease V subunit beta [Pandoraea nosoerga]MBN4681896.1 exodeoxyribonuclease V subunit beta [Pandoraea nosoerga]MBN4745106.1 exodeoxyribonuclease V subunit beta [Pandoraea nosoerga]VVE20528.1 exodeoxyribonuclease V subunit beta [Pandoraea nosoerga]
MTQLIDLDVFHCDLDGVCLIEASAGTGKTWNICALYVRLLLEKRLTVEQILVVTFTNAATAELRERIRARLAGLVAALTPVFDDEHGAEGSGSGEGDDEFLDFDPDASDDPLFTVMIAGLVERADMTPKAIRSCLQTALRGFDQASIHTIHGFCQRALAEVPFAAGLPFAYELVPDDNGVRHDLAIEFWRRVVEPLAARDDGFAAWLVDRKRSPGTLTDQLARRLKKPMSALRWPPTVEADAQTLQDETLLATYREASACWEAEAASIAERLRTALPAYKKNIYHETSLAQAIAAWQRYLGAGDFGAPLSPKAELLTTTRLAKDIRKGETPPAHRFFEMADVLVRARADADERHAIQWLRILREWLTQAPGQLALRKRELRVVSFDDLLGNIARALAQHPDLAQALRARYPCALIDEFQDTDPLQFAIFSAVYGQRNVMAPADEGRGPMFMVGDPKQAIYSFRAADLHTYLAARENADAAYTLAVNQRSTPAIIEAGNRLFGANDKAFVLDGLEYPPVRPGSRHRAPLSDVRDVADLTVWWLPDDEPLPKDEAQQACAKATAAEVARLLAGASRADVCIGERPLAPGDIAVIVQTHRQGALMKAMLAEHGVGSVELTQDSVFASEEAETLLRVLRAVESPGDVRALRAALATELFGLDATALYRMQTSEASDAEAIAWIERLQRYRQLWIERGFAAMWRTLMRELGLAARLVAQAGGERRLTNFMHLAELAQARWAEQPGMPALLRWLASQRNASGGEEAQLRLESDQNLVQIVTVHKSKGLEYGVVFCPFLWDGAVRDGGGLDGLEYHDGPTAVIDFTDAAAKGSPAAVALRREQSAEQARLLYVALTRAVYRCYLAAGIYSSRRSVKEACAGMLNWLAAGRGMTFDAWISPTLDTDERIATIRAAWQALAGGPIGITALPMGDALDTDTRVAHDAPPALTTRASTRALREVWRIGSFSGLLAAAHTGPQLGGAQLSAPERTRPDYDAQANAGPTFALPPAADDAWPPADDILRFPRGPAAGESLHRVFELADFQAPAQWPHAVARALRERPPGRGAEHNDSWRAMMMNMLADTVLTPLRPGLRLADVAMSERLTEMEFTYPADAVSLDALRGVLRQFGYPDLPLDATVLRGYLKGFIDLVFRHDGKWWILDWKSNYLGTAPENYGEDGLREAMAEHGYHLQYLLYTLALHRYLRRRLPDYDYDRDMAGSLYLFVRGVRPDWARAHLAGDAVPGVFFDKPTHEMIDALDRLFAAGENHALAEALSLDAQGGKSDVLGEDA